VQFSVFFGALVFMYKILAESFSSFHTGLVERETSYKLNFTGRSTY